jgi:CHASE2 domain-containing sensor protein
MLTRRRRKKAVRYAVTIARLRIRRFLVTVGAGIITLIAMQYAVVEQSLLGNPDRAMVNMAFKLRADLFSGDGDPILVIDFDDRSVVAEQAAGSWPRSPQGRVPRKTLVDILEFIRTAPPQEQAGAVMMDIDLATAEPEDPETLAMLRNEFEAWAHTPSAPMLVMARQAESAQTYAQEGSQLILPVTDYDDIVAQAPNIFFASVKVMSDQNGIVGDFKPYQCVMTATGPDVLYSAVLLLYAQMERGAIPEDAPVQQWMRGPNSGPEVCKKYAGRGVPPEEDQQIREQINFHFSMGMGETNKVWPDLDPSWNGNGRCPDGERAIFRSLSAADVAAAGPDGSRSILCGRLVVIGGTNLAQSDFQYTPLSTAEMPGPVILANAIRGLQLNNGGMRKLPLWSQILLLIPVAALISAGFAVTRNARREYKRYLRRHPEGNFWVRLRALPFNPVVMNWVLAVGAHYIGVALLLWSLGWGYWGFLSAPGFASAVAETAQEFADDDMVKPKPKKKPPHPSGHGGDSVPADDTA